MMIREKRITFVCPHCGSDNITRDGLLRWSTEAQQWIVDSELDCCTCNECDREVYMKDVELPQPISSDLVEPLQRAARILRGIIVEHGGYLDAEDALYHVDNVITQLTSGATTPSTKPSTHTHSKLI